MYPTTFESQTVTDAHYISRFPIQCLLSLFKTLGARRAKHILYFKKNMILDPPLRFPKT